MPRADFVNYKAAPVTAEEGHLVLVGAPAEEDLPDLAAPILGRFVVEYGLEDEIGTLALEARRRAPG